MHNKASSAVKTQKLFRNGGSQAVRIPKEMVFNTDEVQLHRKGDQLIIEPKTKTLRALSKQMGEPLDWKWESNDAPTVAEKLFS